MNENTSQESASPEQDAEARRDDRRFGDRGFGAGALPFQFLMPRGGGGGPGLAFPLGGSGSPLAFTVPLSGTPAAPVMPVAATAPAAAAQPSTPPSDAPVVGASGDPLYVPPTDVSGEAELLAERVVASAEAFGHSGAAWSSPAFLEPLFGESPTTAEALSPLEAGGAVPSATALFRAIVYPQAWPRRGALGPRYADRFQVLARPGERLAGISPRRGDLLIRVARGQGWGLIGVVGSPGLHPHDRLASLGLRFEGYPRIEPGAYVHLVEPGPRFRGLDARFARRVCDRIGFMLPDTLLLRLRPFASWGEAAEAEPDAGAAAQGAQVRSGQSSAAVRRAQVQLNRIHADLIALRLPGLPGCPLPEDGRFTGRMAQAVLAFQQQVFADRAEWDGSIGPATKGQLDLLAGAAVPGSADAAEGDGGDPNIRWLQDALNRLINAGLAVDGIRGPRTTAAVRQFQQSRSLTADGIVGPRTLAALRTGGEAPSLKLPIRCMGIPERQQIDHFEFGRSEVLPSYQPQIVNLAFCILESQRGATPITTLTVVGHTDTVGSDEENNALGRRRAEAVRDQIMAAIARISGPPPRLSIKVESRGKREEVPGDPALNRRVEVVAPFAFPPKVPPPPPPPPPPALIDEEYIAQNQAALRYVKLSAGAPAFYSKFTPVPHGDRAFDEFLQTIKATKDEIFLTTWFLEPAMELSRTDWDQPISSRTATVLENVCVDRSRPGVRVRCLVWNFLNLGTTPSVLSGPDAPNPPPLSPIMAR